MTNILLSQILSLLTAWVAPDAAAAGHGAGHPHRDWGAKICAQVECTDAQRPTIDAIGAAHREAVADERAEAKRVRAALQAERSAERPDAAKIASLQAELDALKAVMKEERAKAKAKMVAVLTPEQRERLAAKKAERKAKHGGKGKAHGKAKHGDERKAHAKAEDRGKGKAHAMAGPDGKGKAHAKTGPGGKGKQKAFAARHRADAGRAAAG